MCSWPSLWVQTMHDANGEHPFSVDGTKWCDDDLVLSSTFTTYTSFGTSNGLSMTCSVSSFRNIKLEVFGCIEDSNLQSFCILLTNTATSTFALVLLLCCNLTHCAIVLAINFKWNWRWVSSYLLPTWSNNFHCIGPAAQTRLPGNTAQSYLARISTDNLDAAQTKRNNCNWLWSGKSLNTVHKAQTAKHCHLYSHILKVISLNNI